MLAKNLTVQGRLRLERNRIDEARTTLAEAKAIAVSVDISPASEIGLRIAELEQAIGGR